MRKRVLSSNSAGIPIKPQSAFYHCKYLVPYMKITGILVSKRELSLVVLHAKREARPGDARLSVGEYNNVNLRWTV